MTAQTTTPPDRISANEIRELFAELKADFITLMDEVSELRADLATMRDGLKAAAAPAPTTGTFGEMIIDSIVMTYDDNGKPVYKGKGQPYPLHGVRIWDEVLPQLGIDPAALRVGPNPQTPAIRARVMMTTPEEGKTAQPRKVIGKA